MIIANTWYFLKTLCLLKECVKQIWKKKVFLLWAGRLFKIVVKWKHLPVLLGALCVIVRLWCFRISIWMFILALFQLNITFVLKIWLRQFLSGKFSPFISYISTWPPIAKFFTNCVFTHLVPPHLFVRWKFRETMRACSDVGKQLPNRFMNDYVQYWFTGTSLLSFPGCRKTAINRTSTRVFTF